MKNTFTDSWINVDKLDIDKTSDLILTSRTAKEAKPEEWIIKFIKKEEVPNYRILDFGCGFGRNTFGLANYDPMWSVVGYDNDSMLGKTEEYKKLHYERIFYNIEFCSDWNSLKQRKFDIIVAILVCQHILEIPLKKYIEDFKQMSNKWIIHGRRVNDDVKNRSTWKIIEECGAIPTKFYNGCDLIQYTSDGPLYDHNLAIYEF